MACILAGLTIRSSGQSASFAVRLPLTSAVSLLMPSLSVRPILITVTGGAFAVGIACLVYVLAESMKPTDATLLAHKVEIDLSHLAPGDLVRFDWEGNEIFILRRTPEQIEWLKNHRPISLGDYLENEIPSPAFENRFRSLSPDYLVVSIWKNGKYWIIHENRSMVYRCEDFRYSSKSIQVSEETTFPGGFYCASLIKPHELNDAMGSAFIFDPAGRTNSPWYQPLSVPRHSFKGKTLVLSPQG